MWQNLTSRYLLGCDELWRRCSRYCVLQCAAVCCSATWQIARLVWGMGWLMLAGSIKWYVSFAKEPYKRDYILQKETCSFIDPTNRSHPIDISGTVPRTKAVVCWVLIGYCGFCLVVFCLDSVTSQLLFGCWTTGVVCGSLMYVVRDSFIFGVRGSHIPTSASLITHMSIVVVVLTTNYRELLSRCRYCFDKN